MSATEDFINEVILALRERHESTAAGITGGTGILDYASYRQQVGVCQTYVEVGELIRDIASRWNNG